MAAPVKTVVSSERMDRLFQVGPDQPDLHPCLLVSECVGKCQKDRGARCAVVCADKSSFKESVIVASENKNVLLRVDADIELANNVMYVDWATRRVRGEIISFHLRSVLLQNLMYEDFGF